MLHRLSRFFGNSFSVWILVFAIAAFFMPELFKQAQPYIAPLLGLIMFCMGLTLAREDFYEILRRPGSVALGIIGQFLIMPSLAWLLCKVFVLSPEVAVGVILVGCCPGGTASNVMTWLARGDVALSVTITAVTTLLAPFITPALVYILANQWISIPVIGMFWFTLQVVMLPLILGMLTQSVFQEKVKTYINILHLISLVAIVIAISAVVASNQIRILQSGLEILVVVVLHNSLGLLLGYYFAWLLGMNMKQCKTLSIEVGMQNSGMSVALAATFFSPLTALPGALFSVWHNLSGALLVALFKRFR